MLSNITIISCSYNTPQITEVMLKSFIRVHGNGPFNFLISENSNNEDTVNILDNANVKYIRNKGATHVTGVQCLLDACKTKYALLVDTDIVFKGNIKSLIETMKINDLTMLGETCGSRGGFNLYDRVHPWFCMINVDNINKYNIKFNDMKRVKETHSENFYNNIPINNVRSINEKLYDVGATFYEDIMKNNLKIANIPNIKQWFVHYEGSSWQRVSGDKNYEILGNRVWNSFQKEIKIHEDIKITNQFNMKLAKKLAFIYPVFIPNKERLEEAKLSINSWITNIDQEKIDIVLGGWYANEELELEFKNYVMNLDESINIKKFNKNYGKAFIINDLVKNYLDYNINCEYFLTCDSDIILPKETVNIFDRMYKLATKIKLEKNFAYFALEQLGACCHEHHNFDKSLKINDELLVWNSKLDGIAGGALFIDVNFWKDVGGYRVMGVYSGEDGYLLFDSKQMNKFVAVVKTIPIFHPGNTSIEYNKWKQLQIKKCIGKVSNNILEDVKEADKFWEIKDDNTSKE